MERYKAILAYDGTNFSGFQRQLEARSVQAVVEQALTRIGWQGSSLLAAGRTDAGVHASGQVIAFDLTWGHSPAALRDAMNALLPADTAVQAVEPAGRDFHPRFDAESRLYRYRVICSAAPDPLRTRFAWHIWPPVGLLELQGAAGQLTGSRDFSGFGKALKPGGSTVRRVFRSEWEAAGDELHYLIEANAFLFRMVRRIVKAQVEVAAGRKAKDTIENHLDGGSGVGMFQGLAPPQGLALIAVRYPENSNTEIGD